MCMNRCCKKRYSCYRYMAYASEHWQSYSSFNGENCEYYWEVENDRRVRPLNEVKKFEQEQIQAQRRNKHREIRKLQRPLSQSMLRDPRYLDRWNNVQVPEGSSYIRWFCLL